MAEASARHRLIAANWKMNGSRADVERWSRAAVRAAEGAPNEIVLFPPTPWIADVARYLDGSGVGLGGQVCHAEPFGAFTGSVSAEMLRDLGCTHVLCGHSERRRAGPQAGETDEWVAQTMRRALDTGLAVVLCVGETRDERAAGKTREVIRRQLESPLKVLRTREERLIVAYEPVWAIGTGETASPSAAAEAHGWVREAVAKDHPIRAATLRILYGGSVTAANIGGLLAAPDVDGALVGGASLDPEAFARIARAVPEPPPRPGR